MADYIPRQSEAAFTTPTSPSDYPARWNPYPIYILRDEVVYRDSAGNIVGTGTGLSLGSVRNIHVADNAAISADKLADGVYNKVLTADERTKLASIVASGFAYSDAQARDAAGSLISNALASGISFFYDPSIGRLVATVTAAAGGGGTTAVSADPQDPDVLLWSDEVSTGDSNAYGEGPYGDGSYGG
jgi:hypothetical protein